MSHGTNEEGFEEREVTYTLLKDDKFYIVENVPARVNVETGEEFFSPKTVERLQNIVWGKRQPDRFIQTPVFEFSVENLLEHARQ